MCRAFDAKNHSQKSAIMLLCQLYNFVLFGERKKNTKMQSKKIVSLATCRYVDQRRKCRLA